MSSKAFPFALLSRETRRLVSVILGSLKFAWGTFWSTVNDLHKVMA